jgi:benzylsuccinate CoA-transferase BbsF subunit
MPGSGKLPGPESGGVPAAEPDGLPVPENNPAPENTGPLAGIRVLDFGWVWAGALPGQILAFLGAEVIKVETRTRLDYMRVGRPIIGNEPDPEQQPMFHNINRGKLSLTVNFREPAGRDLLLDLVEECDVVVENYAPGVMAKYGLDYDTLRQRRPDLIMLSLSGGGQRGPLRDLRTYAGTVSAYSGLDSLCGYEGEEPVGLQQSYPDPNASLHAALGLLALIVRRKRTGQGDHLDIAQMTAALAATGEAMAYDDLFGEELGSLGNSAPDGEPLYGTYPCAGEDEWVAVEASTDEAMTRLRRLLAVPDSAPAQDVAAALTVWCGGRSHVAAMEELQQAGIAAGAVTTAEDRFANRHYRARGTYQETEHPVIGWEVVYGEPWKWSKGVSSSSIKRAPMLGEANEYVVLDLLGRDRAEYEALVESGVLL